MKLGTSLFVFPATIPTIAEVFEACRMDSCMRARALGFYTLDSRWILQQDQAIAVITFIRIKLADDG